MGGVCQHNVGGISRGEKNHGKNSMGSFRGAGASLRSSRKSEKVFNTKKGEVINANSQVCVVHQKMKSSKRETKSLTKSRSTGGDVPNGKK